MLNRLRALNMTMLTATQRSPERPPDDLEAVFAAVRSFNPFSDNRVNGLSSDGVDVDDIHRAAFEHLTGLAREACALRRGLGAVLWGEAGIGKSHLLARLLRWAERDRQAWAVYLHNLQASPENLPRSLLKAVMSILTQGRTQGFAATPLYHLVLGFVCEALNPHPSARYSWSAIQRACNLLVDRLSAEDSSRAALVDRTVYDVFYRFFRSVYRRKNVAACGDREAGLAVRWLSGDSLDPLEARALGLPPSRNPNEPAALADNQQIKQVLVALGRLALSRKQPLVLCFDQVDNLDDDQAAALSRFLEALLDSAPNLLVVVAGVQSSLLRWREMRVFQDSAWDRLAQHEVHLLRLTPAECRRIVAARLEKTLRPFESQDAVRQQRERDDLFPLGRAWAEVFFRNRIDLRPRDVINGAREGWRREQESLRELGGAAWLHAWGRREPMQVEAPATEWSEQQIREVIDRKVAQKIAEHCELRRRTPDALPPDVNNLAGLVASLLRQIEGVACDRPPSGKPDRHFPFHLVTRPPASGAAAEGQTGMLFQAGAGAHSTTAALRWLLDAAPPPQRVRLVTDERRPLVFGAQADARGRAYYDELRRRTPEHFRHVELNFGEYAHLDALQAVVGMARSGDLEIDLPGGRTRRVSEGEVIDSHRRRQQLRTTPGLQALFPSPAS
jgi:hypothetical protein